MKISIFLRGSIFSVWQISWRTRFYTLVEGGHDKVCSFYKDALIRVFNDALFG